MEPRVDRAGQEPSASFTLIELLVVIAVITILAGIILPVTLRSSAKSRQISCGNNLGQIGRGFYMYSLTFYRVFPPNRPYVPPGSRLPNPTRGDDDLSQLYNGKFIRDLRAFNCPSTTDNAQDYPDASPPKILGEDIKFKRSDKDASGNLRGTQLSYEYLGEYNPGLQYGDINTRMAVVAHDDDGFNFVSTIVSGAYVDQVSNFVTSGKDNHRGAGGNMLFLDGRVEWVVPLNWKQRLVDAFKEWYRVTGWHLRLADKS